MGQGSISRRASDTSMRHRGLVRWSCVLVFALAALEITAALAQSYPVRPITMIVPFAAGGPVDVMSRLVTDRMSQSLGQQVIVENVAGGGGVIGTTRTKRAAPDGYTIIAGNLGTHAAAVGLNANLPYDPSADSSPSGSLLRRLFWCLHARICRLPRSPNSRTMLGRTGPA
jgi:tripartite-type tricarboxylate transporter receptor subunit TctC